MKSMTAAISALFVMLTAAGKDAGDGFLESGRMALGANYWASHAATRMWSKWDEAEVVKDLDVMKEAGFTVLRVFANWAEFQPIVEVHAANRAYALPRETRMFLAEEARPDTPAGHAGVDERLMERFERFCRLAGERGFKLVVCPLTGQMTFRIFIPPSFEGKNVYTDPYCLKWEGRFMEYFVKRLKDCSAIAAWEIGNEFSIITETTHQDVPEFWMRYMHDIIRRADPTRPVIGPYWLELDESNGWRAVVTAPLSDYMATHPYAMWGRQYNEDFNGIRNAFFCAAHTSGQEDVSGRPSFVEEHGSRRAEQTNPRNLARYMRGMLWNCWAADNKAMLWWCAFDQTGMDFAPYSWKEPCVELGIFRRDRTPYPGLLAMKRFAAMQRKLPFAALPRAAKDAVFIVGDSDIVHSSYILARQAGIIPEYQSAEQSIRDAKTYFLPDAKGRAHLTLGNWSALKAKIRAGATLYLSWNDTFLDEMDVVGGVEVTYRDMKKTILQPTTAEVLERNAAGEGVFFLNHYGKGKVYVLAYPMERRLYGGAGGYAGDACRYYRMVCPKTLVLKTAVRDVTVSEHRFDDSRCAVIAVNNGAVPYSGVPAIASGWRVVDAITDDADAAKWEGGKLSLAVNSGILLRLAKEGTDWK